jgi:hypothetical protein
MGHPFHHALSSVRRWGGAAGNCLPLHQWFDESKAVTAEFRHRALCHRAEGIFMLHGACLYPFGHLVDGGPYDAYSPPAETLPGQSPT